VSRVPFPRCSRYSRVLLVSTLFQLCLKEERPVFKNTRSSSLVQVLLTTEITAQVCLHLILPATSIQIAVLQLCSCVLAA